MNIWGVEALANTLYHYGNETCSRIITREIIHHRPLTTTKDLEAAISKVVSFKDRIKTLARCFQALWIAVNGEICALEDALTSMQDSVRPHGRLVILSYHSLEDRRVKSEAIDVK